jgi:hypothetical protein
MNPKNRSFTRASVAFFMIGLSMLTSRVSAADASLSRLALGETTWNYVVESRSIQTFGSTTGADALGIHDTVRLHTKYEISESHATLLTQAADVNEDRLRDAFHTVLSAIAETGGKGALKLLAKEIVQHRGSTWNVRWGYDRRDAPGFWYIEVWTEETLKKADAEEVQKHFAVMAPGIEHGRGKRILKDIFKISKKDPVAILLLEL